MWNQLPGPSPRSIACIFGLAVVGVASLILALVAGALWIFRHVSIAIR